MHLELTRFNTTDDATQGILSIDGKFQCYTLEDPYHGHLKVAGQTRIPSGSYEIRLRSEGGMAPRYQRKFSWHRQGMLWLHNVPGFTYVYIHIGNDEDDSEGCILVGDVPSPASSMDLKVLSSTDAYRQLYDKVTNGIKNGITRITVKDMG